MKYDKNEHGSGGFSTMTNVKLRLARNWLDYTIAHGDDAAATYERSYERLILLDLTTGNACPPPVFGRTENYTIWEMLLRQGLAASKPPKKRPVLVLGSDHNKKAFASLTTRTTALLSKSAEQVSPTRWQGKDRDLVVQVCNGDSGDLKLSACGYGDVVILFVDGNNADQTAFAVNHDELIGLTQTQACVFVFATLYTQSPVKRLRWDDKRQHWRDFLMAVHYSTCPSIGHQDTIFFHHTGWGLWTYAVTIMRAWEPDIRALGEKAFADKATQLRCLSEVSDPEEVKALITDLVLIKKEIRDLRLQAAARSEAARKANLLRPRRGER